MFFRQVVDEKLAQYAYLIGCQITGEAIVIDPERDVDTYTKLAKKNNLRIVAAADTHIHADYLSGLREFAEQGVKVYASDEGGADWKYEWLVGSDYDYQLLKHGHTFRVGNIEFKAIHTPGHTPEHISFLVYDRGGGADEPMGVATGDFMFVGDVGRPDLLESAAGFAGQMEPSARVLYDSVRKFGDLPEFLQVWPAHGAGSACGKALGAVPMSTIGYERQFNSAILAAESGEDEFVKFILDGQPEPPLYFSRMKRDNKVGPRILGDLPKPRPVMASELARFSRRTDLAIVDTRLDRSEFMEGHIPGSVYAPFNKTFNTVVGSYVEEHVPIYLVIDEENVEQAVRDLVRIGLDDIVGYITPEALRQYAGQGGDLFRIHRIDFAEVPKLLELNGGIVLDVRGAAEYQSRHIPGAINVAHTRLLARKDDLPLSEHIYVHCGTGARSAVAAALLARHGFDVTHVDRNFSEWVQLQKRKEAQPAE